MFELMLVLFTTLMLMLLFVTVTGSMLSMYVLFVVAVVPDEDEL